MAKTLITSSGTSNNVGIGTTTIIGGGITTTGTAPYYSSGVSGISNIAGGVYTEHSPAFSLKDVPVTYTSDFSDKKTYQHEVAIIKVFRNDDGVVTKSKMIKTMWVETKTQGSIDYTASKDPEVSEYEPEDIIIKTLRTIVL